jgi:hypothetical protein
MARFFIITGIVLVAIGLPMRAGLPLGRLPGDIVIERGGGTIYLPIVTCLILSVVLSLIVALLRR